MIQRKEEEGDTDDKDRDGGGGAEAVFVLPARPPVLPFPSFHHIINSICYTTVGRGDAAAPPE